MAGPLVGASTEPVQPPIPRDADQRSIAFQQRNSPENIGRLGREFFELIDLDSPAPPPLREEKKAISDLVKAEKYAEALKAFKPYFLKKIAGDPIWNDIEDNLRWGATNPAAYEELMRNCVTRRHGQEMRTIALGEPGTVNWGFQFPPVPGEYDWGDGLSEQFYTVAFLSPLLTQYRVSHDLALMEKWAAFADDWAMNQHDGFGRYGPYDLQPSGASANFLVTQFLATMIECYKTLPPAADGLSEYTLARLLMRYTRELLIDSIVFMRGNASNWSVERAGQLLQTALILNDFKDSAIWLREGRYRLESYNSVVNLRDGTEIQSDPWYLWEWVDWTKPVYTTLRKEALKPAFNRGLTDWFTPEWETEFLESVRSRGRYLAHSIGANGEDPVGFNADKRDRGTPMYSRLQYCVPELFEEPDTRLRLEIAARHNTGREPDYTSEWYPYGGFYFLRTGWKPEDPYATFFHIPGMGSNGFRGQANNNAVYLSAWGMDFFWTGAVAAYNYCKTPVRVDGRDQHRFAGRPQSNHRGFGTAWYDPPQWRWHSSASFDFCEGLYSGPYANFEGHHPRAYSVESIVEANRTAIRDVSHHRLFHAIKEEGLWIVTDRMTGSAPHEYRQDWRLPSPLTDEKTHYPVYPPASVKLDDQAQAIHTEAAGVPNISIFHFGQEKLKYDSAIEDSANSPDQPKKRLVNFQRVGATWNAQGHSQLVTILYPRKNAEAEIILPKPLQLANGRDAGFTLTRKNGTKISYLAAPVGVEAMSIGGIGVTAESLLVVEAPDGAVCGVALGVKEMALLGQTVSLPAPNFEFEARQGAITKTIPIYTPIFPVDILPGRDVFADRLEVKLECRTPGVQIHYTLDNTEPTPDSPLYAAPFVIDRTTRVKARACRPGLTKIPPTQEGTQATVVSSAFFQQQQCADPVPIDSKRLKSGLDYRYFEDDWKFLFLSTAYLTPLKTGTVAAALDTSPKNDQKKKAFAFDYSGFLRIPADGVYTFYAPYELIHGDIWPGYDLQVWLGDKIVGGRKFGLNQWYPGTRIHGLGTWSVALKMGVHRFKMHFADIRPGQKISVLSYTHYTVLNPAGMDHYVWDGDVPTLLVSGPGMEKRPIPGDWYFRQ